MQKKKKREKLFLSNLNIQNFVQNCIITFVTAIPGSTQSKQLWFWVCTQIQLRDIEELGLYSE